MAGVTGRTWATGVTEVTSVTWVTRGNMGENFVDICWHQWAGLLALATYGRKNKAFLGVGMTEV